MLGGETPPLCFKANLFSDLITPVCRRQVYTKNVFGLRTLEKRGDLVSCVLPGVRHIHWHRNDTVFSTCIEKWLI